MAEPEADEEDEERPTNPFMDEEPEERDSEQILDEENEAEDLERGQNGDFPDNIDDRNDEQSLSVRTGDESDVEEIENL